MSSELLPCPFCGGENSHSDKCYIALLAERVTWWSTDERELNEAWNTRAERTCKFERSNPDASRRCTCCDYPIMDYSDLPNYCPSCGAKVVE